MPLLAIILSRLWAFWQDRALMTAVASYGFKEIRVVNNYILMRCFGTQVQCWSQNFWKSVKYMSKICQKTVSYKNVSENSHKCVRILPENCQLQMSVRTLSEKIWKCIRNLSDFINVSENCKCFIWKTLRNVSEIPLETHF